MVRTDYNSLGYFLEHKDLNERQQKWVSKIQAYGFDIEYVKGKKKIMVDALSRKSIVCSLMEISVDWKFHILMEYSNNIFACKLIDDNI